MSLADLKFAVASLAGLAVCLFLTLWVLLTAFCWHTASQGHEQQAIDDFIRGSSWLLSLLALSVAAYMWARA